jgi:hypothetical protein
MSQDRVVDWRERAKLVANEPFNSKDALQLVTEIKESLRASSVGYRALQAARILETVRCANEPSVRQVADAKAALYSLGKALDQVTLN